MSFLIQGKLSLHFTDPSVGQPFPFEQTPSMGPIGHPDLFVHAPFGGVDFLQVEESVHGTEPSVGQA